MAFGCNRLVNRASISSIRSAFRSSGVKPSPTRTAATPSTTGLPLPTKSSASPLRQFSRCPSELGCVQSLLPLHSAVAAARMTSCLSMNCRALSQGTLCCTSPDL